MPATFAAISFAIVLVLLHLSGAVSFGWPVWAVLALAVGSGFVLDVVRKRTRADA